MKSIELTKENLDKLLAAQDAISKLEQGGVIVQDSDEHRALTWAVLSLTDEMLFDKRALTEKEIEYGKSIKG